VRFRAFSRWRRDKRRRSRLPAGALAYDGQLSGRKWISSVALSPVTGNLALQQSVPEASLTPIEALVRAARLWRAQPVPAACWPGVSGRAAGLIQVPTGAGQTYAAVMGPSQRCSPSGSGNGGARPTACGLLFSPRCGPVSRDLALAIRLPIEAMGWPLRVASATRHPAPSGHAKLKNPPQILINHPESSPVALAGKAASALSAPLTRVVLV